ncbi:MAG TPA: nucleoside triphosphate pyrophosphohydrolase, partial [Candidatus Nanoarchaeia archaeon]|nr:nucleoside triphosphate pyrophosphohydrolase [Candidatus Nanoarchaeia archaeon]
GQTIFHAHSHLIPFPEGKDMFYRFRRDFSDYKELSSMLELKDIWKEKGVYVYYENRDNRKFAFFTDIFPMYARYVSAEELGFPEKGNWRSIPKDEDWRLIRNTVKNLKEQKHTVYNKLVRDKIPEIIEQRGKVPVIHAASDEEYWGKLKEKLNEEVGEFQKNSSEEELADILEVVCAIADFKKIDKEKLELLRKKKSEERGGFKKKIILEETK